MYSKNLKVIVWIGLLFLLLSSAAWPQNPIMLKAGRKKADIKADEKISLPKPLSTEKSTISLPASVTGRYADC
jgi:hypothetical protein